MVTAFWVASSLSGCPISVANLSIRLPPPPNLAKIWGWSIWKICVRLARPACPNCSGGWRRKVKVSRREDFNASEGRCGAACRPVLWGGGGAGWWVVGGRKSTPLQRSADRYGLSRGWGATIHPLIQYFLLPCELLPCIPCPAKSRSTSDLFAIFKNSQLLFWSNDS